MVWLRAFHALLPLLNTAPDSASLRLSVDSARHEVRIELQLPAASPAADDHSAHQHGGHHLGHVPYTVAFAWPVSGWVRGVRAEVEDSGGAALPPGTLHHVNLLNYERRLLLYDDVERVWAAGAETGPVLLPSGIGVPLQAGTRMGVVVALASGAPRGTRVRFRIRWSPDNLAPRPLSAFPVWVDVNFRPGFTDAYDLPAGPTQRVAEFTMPLDGRVIGIGGHLHDYGRLVRLDDVATGRAIFELHAVTDSAGRILGMPIHLFGVAGRGRALQAGRRYRLTAVYDNPTGQLIPLGAMGGMSLLLVPRHPERWPRPSGLLADPHAEQDSDAKDQPARDGSGPNRSTAARSSVSR